MQEKDLQDCAVVWDQARFTKGELQLWELQGESGQHQSRRRESAAACLEIQNPYSALFAVVLVARDITCESTGDRDVKTT